MLEVRMSRREFCRNGIVALPVLLLLSACRSELAIEIDPKKKSLGLEIKGDLVDHVFEDIFDVSQFVIDLGTTDNSKFLEAETITTSDPQNTSSLNQTDRYTIDWFNVSGYSNSWSKDTVNVVNFMTNLMKPFRDVNNRVSVEISDYQQRINDIPDGLIPSNVKQVLVSNTSEQTHLQCMGVVAAMMRLVLDTNNMRTNNPNNPTIGRLWPSDLWNNPPQGFYKAQLSGLRHDNVKSGDLVFALWNTHIAACLLPIEKAEKDGYLLLFEGNVDNAGTLALFGREVPASGVLGFLVLEDPKKYQ